MTVHFIYHYEVHYFISYFKTSVQILFNIKMLSLFDGCTIVSLIAFIFKILHFTTKVYIVTGLKKHNWAEGQQILKINTYMFSYTLLSNLFKFLFFRPIKTIEMKQDPHEGETSNYFEGQKQNKSGEFKPPSFNILSLSSKLYSVLVQIQACDSGRAQ